MAGARHAILTIWSATLAEKCRSSYHVVAYDALRSLQRECSLTDARCDIASLITRQRHNALGFAGHNRVLMLREQAGMDNDLTLLSVGDAAKRLERSTEQVRRYLREGRLKGKRVGGQWFIDRDVLDVFASATQARQSFVDKLRVASSIRPLDDVIGIGQGAGTNIGDGKASYRLNALRRRS